MQSVTATNASARFWLGEWCIDPGANRMLSEQCDCQIEPRQMAVLIALARAPDTMLTKSQLLDAVWPHRFVVDGVLKRAVSELRRALGDDARAPRYIQTVYKVGYRLVAIPQPCVLAAQRWLQDVRYDMTAVRSSLARDALCAQSDYGLISTNCAGSTP